MLEIREQAQQRPITYCVVPRVLAPRLHEHLRRHFAAHPAIEVVVEQRAAERRATRERRSGAPWARPPAGVPERRRIRAAAGRRVADRRAAALSVPAPVELPRRARAHTGRIVFVERLVPSTEVLEDQDTARLVTRFQAGDGDVFPDLYRRYFDRVYGYLRMILNDEHAAEDVTQQVFMRVLGALERYERRAQPFRAWLFTIVRNAAIDHLGQRNRMEPVEADELERRMEDDRPADLSALHWITDPDLLLFIERLPLIQRQVLLLRFMLDLDHAQVAEILGRKPDDVRALQSRALRFLRARLAAVGRGAHQGQRARMRRVPDKANVLRARRFALR